MPSAFKGGLVLLAKLAIRESYSITGAAVAFVCGGGLLSAPLRVAMRAWLTSRRARSRGYAVINASSRGSSLACRVAQLYAVATLEQPRRFHPVRPGRKCSRRTAPAKRLDLFEERRIRAQGGEFLEQQ